MATGRVGGVMGLELAPQPAEIGVVDAVGGKAQQRLLQVFARRAIEADGMAQPFHHAGIGKRPA